MSREEDIDLLARTAWAEARGESRRGMAAVINVVMTRVRHPRRWGNTVASVVKQRAQFSPWTQTDPNHQRMLAVTERDPQFREALELAEMALNEELADETGGADHFHSHRVRPSWARGQSASAIIGNHVFYRLA